MHVFAHCTLKICISVFQPEIDKSNKFSKAVSEIGMTGQMTCKAKGAPPVRFQWRKVCDITLICL